MPSLSSNTQSARRRFSVLVAWLLLGVVAIVGALGISSFVFADDDGNTQPREGEEQYSVAFLQAEHGKIAFEADPDAENGWFSAGEKIVLTITPDEGYYTSGLSLDLPFEIGKDESREEIAATTVPFDGNISDGKISFEMPKHSVVAKPVFSEGTMESVDSAVVEEIPSSKDVIKNALSVPDTQLDVAQQLQQMFGAEFDTSGVTASDQSVGVNINVITPDSWEKNKDLAPHAALEPYIAGNPYEDEVDAQGVLHEKCVLFTTYSTAVIYDVNGLSQRVIYVPDIQKLGGKTVYAYLTTAHYTGDEEADAQEPCYQLEVDMEKGLVYIPSDVEDYSTFTVFLLLTDSNIDALNDEKITVSIVDENGNELDSLVFDKPVRSDLADMPESVDIPLPQGTSASEVAALNADGNVWEDFPVQYNQETNSVSVDLSQVLDSKLVLRLSSPSSTSTIGLVPEDGTLVQSQVASFAFDRGVATWSNGDGIPGRHLTYPTGTNDTFVRYLRNGSWTGHNQEAWCCDPTWLGQGETSGATTTIVDEWQRLLVYYCGVKNGEINWNRTSGWDPYIIRHHVIAKVINADANHAADYTWDKGLSAAAKADAIDAQNQIWAHFQAGEIAPSNFICAIAWTSGEVFVNGSAQNIVVFDYIPYGYIKFHKGPDPAYQGMVNEDPSYYKLQGTKFHISGNGVERDVVIDDNGWGLGGDTSSVSNTGGWIALSPGNYTITEIEVGQGYQRDKGSWIINVPEGGESVVGTPGMGGDQTIDCHNKTQVTVKLTKGINPLYTSIYNSDPVLQDALRKGQRGTGVEVTIHVDGNQGAHNVTSPKGDEATTYTKELSPTTVNYYTGNAGGGPVTLKYGEYVTCHLWPAGCDEGKAQFGTNFNGWYALEELDYDSTGMLFDYYVEPHDPVTGARIYPAFQVTQGQTTSQTVSVLNIPLIPVDFWKKAYDVSGNPVDPSTLDYADEVQYAEFRIWRAESDSDNPQGMQPQPQRVEGTDQTSEDIWKGSDLGFESFNGMRFDNPDTGHGVYSENGKFEWVSGGLATIDQTENSFAQSIADTATGDLTKYVTDEQGHFRAYLLPSGVAFPTRNGLADFHGTYVLEELTPPKDYLLPHGIVNGQLTLIYPMFHLGDLSTIPSVNIADERIEDKPNRPKNLLVDYEGLLDDKEHYSQSGAQFRVFVDKLQESNADSGALGIFWDDVILYFGDPDYTKQVMTPDAAVAQGLNPGAIGDGPNNTWLFSNDDEEWSLLPAGSFMYNGEPFKGWYCLDEVIAPQGLLWPHDEYGVRLCPRFQITGTKHAGVMADMTILDMPVTQYTLHKSYNTAWDTHVVDDTHYMRSQENAKFHIFADPNQSPDNEHVVTLDEGLDSEGITVTNSKPSSFQLAVADPATGSMTTDQSDYYSFEIGSDGNLALPDYHHFHLLPQYAPDSTSVVKFNGESSSVVAGHSRGVNWYTSSWIWPRDGGIFNGYYVIDEYQAPIGFLWPHDDDGNKLCQRFQVCEVMGLTDEMFEPGPDTILEVVDEPIRTFEIQKVRDGQYTYDSGDGHYDNNQVSATFNIYAAQASGGVQSEASCITSVGGSQTFSLPTGSWTFASGSPDKSKALVDNNTGQLASTTPVDLHTGADGRLMEHVHLLPDGTPTDSVLVASNGTYTQADPRYVSGGVPTGVTKGFHGYYVIDETQSPKGYMWPHDNTGAKLYPLFQVKRDCTEVVGFQQGATTGISVGDDNHNFVNEPIAEFELQKYRDDKYEYDIAGEPSASDHYATKQDAALFKIYAAAVKSGNTWTAASASNQQSETNCKADLYSLPTKSWSFVHGRPDTTHAVSNACVTTSPWPGWTLWTSDADARVFMTDANGKISDVHLLPDCAPAAYGGYDGFHGYYVVDEIQAPRGYIWPHDDNAEKIYPMFHIKRGETQIVGFSDNAVTGLEEGDGPKHLFINEPIAEFELQKQRDEAYTYDSGDAHFDNKQNAAIFTIYSAAFTGNEQNDENCTVGTFALPTKLADGQTSTWTYVHGKPDKKHAVSERAVKTDPWEGWSLWTKDNETPYQFVTDDNGLIKDIHLIPDCAPAAYGGYQGFHGYYVVDEIQAPEGYLWPHADNAEKLYPMFHIIRGQTRVVGFSPTSTTGLAPNGDDEHNFVDEPYGEFALHKVENPNYLYTQDDAHYNCSQGTNEPGDENTTGAKFRIYADVTQAATGDTVKVSEAKADTEEVGWVFQHSQPDRQHALIDTATGRLGPDEQAVVLEPDAEGWIRDVHLLPESAPAAYLNVDPKTGVHQAEAQSEFSNGVYDGFHGWYVIDEFESPQGYIYPHDDDGNQVFPRFHIARGETKVVGWTEEKANSDKTPNTENGTTIGVGVEGDNPHPFYDEGLAKFELHKLGDSAYTYIEGDEQTDEKQDGHFRVDQNGAVFNIYADQNQTSSQNVMQTPSGSWKFDTGQPDWTHAVSDRALDTTDWRNWTLWTRQGEEVHDFTTTDGGWIKDVHLIADTTPAKYGGYDGFHGYYVLDEVDCPTGYLVPHAEDGAKIYPRFHVARNQTDVSGFSDQAYSGNADVKVEAGVTEPAENEHAFIDQPIGEFELNKKYNAEFDSMVKNGDGGEGDPAYDPTFADATFNIYVDKNQGDVEGTVSGPYWTVQAGTPDMQHALIDRRTGKMGPDTPETELTVLENNRTLKNGYLNLANEDGELWIRDIHLLPGGAPDMSEKTDEKGTLQPGAKANIDTNLYTDLNHTFKGWYVIDEVIWPKGFMWPHASNGQKLYPRFQIAYDELDTVGYFGTGESGLDVDVENGAMGPFYDEAISVFNLHKTVDEAQQPPAGDKNYSSANPENAEQVNGINTVFKIYADTNQNKEASSYTPFEGATAYTTGTRDFNAVVVDRNTGRVAPDNYQHASNAALPDQASEAEKAELFVVDENGWVKDIHLLPAETSEDLFSGMPDSAPRYHATAMRLPKDSNGVFQGYYVLDEVQRAAGYLFPHDAQGNQLYPRFQVVRGQADPEFSYDLINEIQVPVQIVKTRDADYNEMIDGTDDEAEPQVSGQVREDEETQETKGDEFYSLIGAKVKIFADQDQTIDDRLYGNPTKTLDDGTIVSLGVKGPYSAEMVASEYGPYDKNGLWYKSDSERVPGQMADEGAEPIDDVYVFETQELNGKAVINAYLLPSESSDQFFTNNGLNLENGQQTDEPTAEYPHGYSYGAARFQLPRDENGVFNGYYVLAEVEAPSGYLRVHDANGNLLYPRFRVTRGQTTVATPLYNEAEGHTGVTKLTTDTYKLIVQDDEGKQNENYTLAGAKVRIYPDVDQKTKLGEEERPFFGTPDWKYAFYNQYGYYVDATDYLRDVSYDVNTASDGEQKIYYQEVDEDALFEDSGIKLQTFVTDEEGKFVAHLPSTSGGIIGHPDFNGYYVVDELIAPKGYLLPHIDEGLDKGQKLYPRFCVDNEDTRIANEDKGQVLPDLPYGGYDGDHEDVDSRNGGHATEYHDDPARVFFSAVKVDSTMLDPNTNEIVFDPDTHDPIHNKNAALAGAQFELRDSNDRTWAGVSDRNGHVEFYTEEFATLLTQIQNDVDLKAEYRALLDNEEIEDFPSALIQFGLNHGYNFASVYIPLGHFKITEVANPIGFRVPEQPVVAEGDITSDDVERYQKDLGDLYLTPSGSEFHYGNYDVTDQRYWTEDESFTPTDQRLQYEFSCTQCKHAEYRNVESIEEGFTCPVCGADAEAFELIKQTNTFNNTDLYKLEDIKAFDISLKKVKPSDYGDTDSYRDPDMQTPMKGVHFEIYRLNSLDDREGELVGTMVTGSDGVATTYNYPSGVEWDADPDNPVADWELYDRYGNCLLSRDQDILPTDGTRLWLSDGNPIDSTLTSDGVRGALAYTLYGYRIHELPINVDDELRLASDIIIKPQQQVDGYTYQVGTILNYPVTHLQFIKVDQETGEVVPAKGFTFELYEDFDEDGVYTPEDLVTQVTTYPRRERVGQWTTDETGQVTMPAPLKAGKYIVHEVSCGDVYPYIISENTSVDFHPLHPTTDFEVITTEFPNKSAYGHVQFRKVDKDTGEPIEGAVFKIRAAEDIKRADGSIAVPEGSFVSCKGTDSAVITLVSGPDGTAKCCDGEHEDGCLPIDATDGVSEYDLVEVKAADGYSLPDEPTHFQVKYENDQTPDVMVNLGDIENEALKIQLTKASDEVEHMSLPGASYMLWDSGDAMKPVVEVPQGKQAVNIILQSANGPVGVRPHVGNGGVATTSIEAPGYVTLAPEAAAGESYVLVQNEQQGIDAGTYQVIYHASDVADETTVIDTIEVKTGDAINVKLDETGTPVIEQTTVTDTGLVTPQELEAHPGTYELALNPGVYDVFASGTLVSETSPLVVTDSDVTYFAGEGDVPAGRWIRDLVSSDAPMAVETTEGEEGKLIYSRLGHWGVDTVYHFAEVNPPDGYTVDHTVYEIRVGADNQPVFVEMTAAEQRANNQNLVVADGGRSLTVFDAPTRVQISKQDATTGEEIEGAHLTVFDSEGNVVEEWVSGTSPHIIEGLKPGKYTLREVITPRTHEKANDVTFEVNDDGNVVEQVVMFDEEIKIDAEIDKRQEIANPPASDYEANGDGASKAETQINKDGTYDYSLDYRSKSTTWTDEFTVQDDLDMATKGYAYLEGITTAQGGEDYNGLMNVWYKTNKDDELIAIDKAPEPESNANATKDGHEKDNPWLTDESVNGPVLGRVGDDLRVIDYRGWHLWQADVPTDKATNLSVADLGLAKDEYVTGFRFEYGRVAKDFTTRQDRWNEHDPMIKNIHDDVNEVASQNKGTFKQNGKEVAYAPAQIHMRATAAYTGEARIDNAARVDAYRNGGVLPGDEEGTHYGDLLEGHDVDQVTQVPKSSDVNISGKLDKRQEIADPTADRTEANGDGKNTAATTVSEDGFYDYSLDFVNTSSTWVDEFTITDSLDAVKDNIARLTGVTTPKASEDFDGLVNVWYKTKASSSYDRPDSDANQTLDDGHVNEGVERQLSYAGYRLWKAGVSLSKPEVLNVSDLNILDGDYVTDIRFEFGRVEPGFTSRTGLWDRDDLYSEHDDVADVPSANEEGYAPIIVHMQVTPDYVEGKPLNNSAVLDLYRLLNGSVLGGHDKDAVTQTPKLVVSVTPGTPSSDVASYKVTSLLDTGIPALMVGFAAIGGIATITYTIRRVRNRNRE